MRDALASLYDLPYLQSHPLVRLLPSPSTTEPAAQARLLQHRLLDAIEHLRPVAEDDATDHATQERAARRYDLLKLRYVEGLDIPRGLSEAGVQPE